MKNICEYVSAILQASDQDPPYPSAVNRILIDTKMPQGKDTGMSRQKRYEASQGSFFIGISNIKCSAAVVKKAVTC